MNTNTAMYGLKLQTRSMCAQLGQNISHRFLVGTVSSKEENEIHLIEYSEDDHDISCSAIYSHSIGEAWNLSSCPYNSSMFFTSTYTKGSYQTTLWKMKTGAGSINNNNNNESGGGAISKEEKRATLTGGLSTSNELENILAIPSSSRVHSAIWSPHDDAWRSLIIDDTSLRVFDMKSLSSSSVSSLSSSSSSIISSPLTNTALSELTSGSWDPHHPDQFVTTDGKNIRGWDLRSLSNNKETHKLINVHNDTIRDIDFNPNRPYTIVTGGEDRRVCIWDLRKPSIALKTLYNHTHWVWNTKFNRFHDQLILTAGTELVNLWSILSVSSAPLGDLENSQNNNNNNNNSSSNNDDKSSDRLIKTYSDHEDSIYAICWSAYDAWIFASLSYDGRFVINHVPAQEKYRILL